jgi:hypothetical protein
MNVFSGFTCPVCKDWLRYNHEAPAIHSHGQLRAHGGRICPNGHYSYVESLGGWPLYSRLFIPGFLLKFDLVGLTTRIFKVSYDGETPYIDGIVFTMKIIFPVDDDLQKTSDRINKLIPFS